MCGRFSLIDARPIFERFGVRPPEGFRPRYNVAPGQDCLVLIEKDEGVVLKSMRWGLIPSWAKDPAIGYKTINARAETVAEKPAYRDSFKKCRCLVIADGYYEWLHPNNSTRKIPLRFTLKSGEPFTFGGLWASCRIEDTEPIESFTIVTTAADPVFSQFHDRSPLILHDDDARKWLSPKTPVDEVKSLLKTYSAMDLKGYEVASIVNASKNEVPECVQPVGGVTWP